MIGKLVNVLKIIYIDRDSVKVFPKSEIIIDKIKEEYPETFERFSNSKVSSDIMLYEDKFNKYLDIIGKNIKKYLENHIKNKEYDLGNLSCLPIELWEIILSFSGIILNFTPFYKIYYDIETNFIDDDGEMLIKFNDGVMNVNLYPKCKKYFTIPMKYNDITHIRQDKKCNNIIKKWIKYKM